MLVIPPTSSRTACLMSLDPGSDTLGTAKLDIDLESLDLMAITAQTLKGGRAGRGSWESEMFGERLGRIHANQQTLLGMFRFYRPFIVASESPFISRRMPTAYGALMEVICSIRAALYEYDEWKQLHLYDPITVKMAVGATKFKGKDPVRDGVLAFPNIQQLYTGSTPLEDLDEHSLDAIAVGICQWQALRKEAGLV